MVMGAAVSFNSVDKADQIGAGNRLRPFAT